MFAKLSFGILILFSLQACQVAFTGSYRVLPREYAVFEGNDRKKMFVTLIDHGVVYGFAEKTEGAAPVLSEEPPATKSEAVALFREVRPPRLLEARVGQSYDFMSVARNVANAESHTPDDRVWWIVSIDPVVLAHSASNLVKISGPLDTDGRAILSRKFGLITDADMVQEVTELHVLDSFPPDPGVITGNATQAWDQQIQKKTRHVKLAAGTSLANVMNNPNLWKN